MKNVFEINETKQLKVFYIIFIHKIPFNISIVPYTYEPYSKNYYLIITNFNEFKKLLSCDCRLRKVENLVYSYHFL